MSELVLQAITYGGSSHECDRWVARTPILLRMQTRYLLVASVLTGLAILVAAAIWMATRL